MMVILEGEDLILGLQKSRALGSSVENSDYSEGLGFKDGEKEESFCSIILVFVFYFF